MIITIQTMSDINVKTAWPILQGVPPRIGEHIMSSLAQRFVVVDVTYRPVEDHMGWPTQTEAVVEVSPCQ